MLFKHGVQLRGVRPEIIIAMNVADRVFRNHGAITVITSVVDGVHSAGSLHYAGAAVDFRMKHIEGMIKREDIAIAVEKALTGEFDVILENNDTDYPHLHVEFQPKQPLNT